VATGGAVGGTGGTLAVAAEACSLPGQADNRSLFLVLKTLATVDISACCAPKLSLMEKFDELGFLTGSGPT